MTESGWSGLGSMDSYSPTPWYTGLAFEEGVNRVRLKWETYNEELSQGLVLFGVDLYTGDSHPTGSVVET